MGNTAELDYPTGASLYTQWDNESGLIYNGTSYVTKVLANWQTYAVSTPETPSGFGTYVSTIPYPTGATPGTYKWRHYLKVGTDPDPSDPCVGGGSEYFDGTNFVDLSPNALDVITAEAQDGSVPRINFREAQGLILDAACFGQLENVGSDNPIIIKNPAGTVNRAQVTVNPSNNRTNIEILNLP